MDRNLQEELEWQFPPLRRYQINDYLNRGFKHKDSMTSKKTGLTFGDAVIPVLSTTHLKCDSALKRGTKYVERFTSLNVCFNIVIKTLSHTFPC